MKRYVANFLKSSNLEIRNIERERERDFCAFSYMDGEICKKGRTNVCAKHCPSNALERSLIAHDPYTARAMVDRGGFYCSERYNILEALFCIYNLYYLEKPTAFYLF